MHIVDAVPGPAAGHLEMDAREFAALEASDRDETLRFWEADRSAVVIGRSGDVSREVREAACAADDVPIVRRSSGGGAVVVGPGCLNYTAVLSLERRPSLLNVAASYAWILGRIAEALGVEGVAMAGASDLAIDGRKVSGNAQRRGRRALLHHGTLLYAFDLALIERYLRTPPRQPAYRAGRGHTDFVANVPLDARDIREQVARALGCGH